MADEIAGFYELRARNPRNISEKGVWIKSDWEYLIRREYSDAQIKYDPIHQFYSAVLGDRRVGTFNMRYGDKKRGNGWVALSLDLAPRE